jgi:hypothetical protein
MSDVEQKVEAPVKIKKPMEENSWRLLGNLR